MIYFLNIQQMYKIIYSEKVKDDLTKIKDFIILDNPIYALKTINSIIKTINLLENFPYIWKELWDNLRELVENNYKYKIVYKIYINTITIISIYKYQKNWK